MYWTLNEIRKDFLELMGGRQTGYNLKKRDEAGCSDAAVLCVQSQIRMLFAVTEQKTWLNFVPLFTGCFPYQR